MGEDEMAEAAPGSAPGTVGPVIGRRRRQRAWLDGWEAVAAERLAQWPSLDGAERAVLGGHLEWMVRTKHWEAARGFELTQEMVVTVAAHAGLLLLGLDRHAFREVRAVVVHPRTVTRRGVWSTSIRGVVTDGPRRVLGHAVGGRGPVVLSWAAVERDLRQRDGQNVVLHELAHKLDAVDGLFDGTPELDGAPQRAEWVRVCTAEYRRLRREGPGDGVLRAYAAESPSEFFAVATEAFFERPTALRADRPALYEVLRQYYGQDPAARGPSG
ncbi:MAG: zinc-dependent peptidase [Acidimicrobiia bacterium]